MDVLSKAADAALMFWQALDERERMAVLYVAAWAGFAVLAAIRRRSRDSLRLEILEELTSSVAGSRD